MTSGGRKNREGQSWEAKHNLIEHGSRLSLRREIRDKRGGRPADTLKATISTNQCLLHLRRAPAVFPIEVGNICPRGEAASALKIAGDNRTDATTE